MNGTTKRRVGFGALTGLVIAGVIGVNSFTASGGGIAIGPPETYGALSINLATRTGTIVLDLANGPTYTQAITTQQPCSTVVLGPIMNGSQTVSTTESLLTFTGLFGTTAAGVQLPSNGLGVDSANCGTPAGLIGPYNGVGGEKLQVSLGSFAGFFADDPDVEGENPVRVVTVASGTLAIGRPHAQGGNLKVKYDNNPILQETTLNGTGVKQVPVLPFNESITLESTADQQSRGLSLNSSTTFNLVGPPIYDEAIPCGGDVGDPGGAGEIALNVTFYRAYDELKGENKCTDEIGVTVEILEDYVYWDNSTVGVGGAVQAVAGLVTVEWAPIPTSLGPEEVQAQLAREIDYDAEGAADFVDVQWCSSFAESEGSPFPVPGGGTARGFDVVMPTDVPWCLVSDTQTLVDGNIMQVQQYYGAGDPYNR